MLLEEMTMEEFSAGLTKTKTLAVPYGTLEAHGRHLPLNTDTLTMCRVLEEAAREADFFIAPPVHYGVCTSTGQHPGSIGITPPTLRRVTTDIVNDAYHRGLRNILLISGHGGGAHVAAMKEAAELMAAALPDLTIAALSIYDVIWDDLTRLAETENDSHAGEMETSVILHLAPNLVKGRSAEEYPKLLNPLIYADKQSRWPGAVWGNPEKATAEKGKELFTAMVRETLDILKKMDKAGL
ncbi:MAG: creatininase family protein [Thermodesulfobacteriota bacterium]